MLFRLIFTTKIFLSRTSGISVFGGSGGGRRRAIPISVLMLDVRRKNVNSRNEMSAIELVFRPGVFLLAIIYFFFIALAISTYIMEHAAANTRT